MSKRMDVLNALKALFSDNLGAEVKGLDEDAAFPARVPPNGLVIVRNSHPGDPEIDLCPPAYHFEHPIAVEVAAHQSPGRSLDQAVDDILVAIGHLIEANRTLGGLCTWLDAETGSFEDIRGENTRPAGTAIIRVIASYSTSNPLT